MIRPAGSLRETSRNKTAINGQVKEILKAMEVRMADANKEGRNNIGFDVPMQFTAFPNDHDAELLIIATVLRELKAGDYRVKITKQKNDTLLFDIRWIAEMTDIEREKMKRLLVEHMAREESDDEDE
jgi:hypothetical protein